MSWTAPRTWVTGEVVTSAELNTHIRDNENALWAPITGAYAEFTAPVTVASPTTVVTAGVAVTANGSTSYKVIFYAPYVQLIGTSGNTLNLNLFDNGSDIGLISSLKHNAAAVENFPLGMIEILLSGSRKPSAGSHTYSITATQANGSPVIEVGTSGGGNIMAGYIHVLQSLSPT